MILCAKERAESEGASNCLFYVADNREIPIDDGTADLSLAGWTLSYLKSEAWSKDDWKEEVDVGLCELERVTKPGGVMVILETLGTACTEPTRNNHLFGHLEASGFERRWFRTDYTFQGRLESLVLTEMFYGKSTVAKMDLQGGTLAECSGIWTKSISIS